jgi:hypothetical protein
MTTTPGSPLPLRTRNRLLVTVDVIVGIVVIFFGLLLALVVVAAATQFGAINAGVCESGPYEGLTCNAGALSFTVGAMITVALFGWALTLGMFIVNLIRRRLAFYWPIIGFVIIVASFWIGTYVISLIAEKQ